MKCMKEKVLDTCKLTGVAIVIGVFVGAIVAIFALCIVWCNTTRASNEWLVFLLPVGGVAIVGIHKLAKVDDPRGTNRVIARIHESTYVKTIMAPLIFASTLISQICGASVGREAAALQIGGALGSLTGKALKIKEEHAPTIIMSGMSAAFSALFGTPIASALFALEIADGRIKNWSATIPCFISSFIAYALGTVLQVPYLNVQISNTLSITPENLGIILLLSLLCAMLCVIFVLTSKWIKLGLRKLFKNSFFRILATSAIIVALTLVVGEQTYNGVGSDTILACLTDNTFQIVWWACLLKILFTNVSLGGGFQGGEIVPVLFIGATLGNAFSQFTPIDPTLCASLGMVGLFSSATKCPLASITIAFELFGFANPVFIIETVVVSILLSGPHRIYEEQQLLQPSLKIIHQ